MTQLPIHTPYDGSSKPFAIGLKPLDLKEWTEVDDTFDSQLAEKRRLYAEHADRVFVAEEGTEEAQAEVLGLLLDHLPVRFPDRYRRCGEDVVITGIPEREATDLSPLRKASLLVQEDLILMRRGDDGWRLVAGALCFPSSWALTEKFGKPMSSIHGPVPGFGPGTRNAELIDRMFDKLQVVQPVVRVNWSIQLGDALYRPMSNDERNIRKAAPPNRFPDVESAARAFIRIERQTLRKLPVSGDILFTIRIYLDPLSTLKNHPDRAALATSFADQLMELEAEQLDYKGLTADRDLLVAVLKGMA
ncbi:MAG: DUF3445 domain-containing protein [Mesorhizobium sp.]|nr:DUF3445 domain-containing protein [Mesorhizobium sp.]MBL8578269.1 DUF3445 domain-containing protein [Mesorhizobium sp.]